MGCIYDVSRILASIYCLYTPLHGNLRAYGPEVGKYCTLKLNLPSILQMHGVVFWKHGHGWTRSVSMSRFFPNLVKFRSHSLAALFSFGPTKDTSFFPFRRFLNNLDFLFFKTQKTRSDFLFLAFHHYPPFPGLTCRDLELSVNLFFPQILDLNKRRQNRSS